MAFYPERVLDSTVTNGKVHYLVSWRGSSERTWEHTIAEDRPDLVKAYLDEAKATHAETVPGAFVYCRVSSARQADNLAGHTSLDEQEREIVNFCEQRGMPVLLTIRETCSAKNMAKLVGLRHLINLASRGHHICVYDASRFSRNIAQALDMIDTIKDNGVLIDFVKENITLPSNAHQANHARMQLCAATHMSELLSERSRATIARRRAAGGHIGPYPYGFMGRRDERGVIKKIENPAERRVIDRILHLYRTEDPAYICYRLNVECVTFRGRQPTVQRVKSIIRTFGRRHM